MNTDYEGEISDLGDKVYIRTVPKITINNYERGGELSYEKPESPAVELRIDKGKSFSFEVNDVDAYQSDLRLMDDWSNDASEEMQISVDTDILGDIYPDAHEDNAGAEAGRKSGAFDLGETGAPVSLTKDNILDYIVDLGTVLDEQSVPHTNRWLVLPAWACGLIKKSELKDASLAGDGTSIMRNGRVGIVDRFTIYMSNNVAYDDTDSAHHILAGHKRALTFAGQMTKMEDLRNPKDFGDLVRGLKVFGYKVIQPEAMAHLYATKG